MRIATKLIFSATVALAATAAAASGSINTVVGWNGSSSEGPFGDPDTGTFGQSITMDASGGRLQSFSFYLTPLNLNIRSYVYLWDGLKAVGAPLFAGPMFNIGAVGSGFKEVAINTGGIDLAPNKQYVLLLTSSGMQSGLGNTNNWGVLRSNVYAGGEFVFHNSSNTLASLQSDWDCGDGCGFAGTGFDLAFKAQIDPVAVIPEPEAAAMMLFGLAAVGIAARRRRSNS